MLIALILLAVLCVLVGALTAAKWLLIIAVVLVIAAALSRR